MTIKDINNNSKIILINLNKIKKVTIRLIRLKIIIIYLHILKKYINNKFKKIKKKVIYKNNKKLKELKIK